ncbi:MAG: trypsin-like serine protease [Planctomycetes bacterium]|nr:trypsin-like serine protease [Planctomycetota bacterium]
MRSAPPSSRYVHGRTLVYFSFWVGSVVGSICWAGIIRHDREAAEYRKLGREEAFQCVGQACWKPLGKPAVLRGGAVLISPRWVLTAGHIAIQAPLHRLRFRFRDEDYRAVKMLPHPRFDRKAHAEGALRAAGAGVVDLALVELDRPVKNVELAVRYRGRDEVGQVATIVGNGSVGDGKAGLQVPPSFERLGGRNVIDGAGGRFGEVTLPAHVLLFDFDDPNNPAGNQLGGKEPLPLEIGTSKGDSGGGWFIKDGGAWKLVAITVGRLPPSGDPKDDGHLADFYYGALSAGMRISTANDWIDRTIGAAPEENR